MPLTPHLPFSRKNLDDSIAELEAYKAELERELALTDKRIAWLLAAPELFDADEADDAANALNAEDRAIVDRQLHADPDAGVMEVIPASAVVQNGAASTPGTLRQTLLQVFLDRPPKASGTEYTWKAASVITELERRGQLPQGEYGEATVRRMLRDMAKRDQLDRPANGKFRLAKGVREAGGIVLHAPRGPGDLQRQIIEVLYAAGTPLSPSEIHASIRSRGATVSRGSIHNTLARLMDLDRVNRVAPGQYRLPPGNGSSP